MSEDTLHHDAETRATVDIKLGVDKYAEHHATRVLCWGFKFNAEPAFVWRPLKGDAFPQRVIEHVKAGKRTVAHNSAFDRTIWNGPLRRQFPHIPVMTVEQTDCTMVRALALGLPGGLDMLCKALRLPITKDAEGYKVMMKLCKPQKSSGQLVWNDDPELFEQLYAYCRNDVEAEAPIDDLLPRLIDQEQAIWQLSELINARGIQVDVDNVRRAAELVELEGKSLALAVSQLTRGQAKPTQRAKLLGWLDNNGLDLPDMKKHTVRDALRTELPTDDIRRVLLLQTEANKTSTAKLKKMAARVCADGRARSEYRFNGAGTGRWSSTGIQLHNFSRPSPGFKLADADNVYEWLQQPIQGARAGIAMEYGSVMYAMSNSLRPLLMASEGRELICADYSNIEGRVLAWMAGEDWKLDAFRAYDAGTGPDLYKLAFSRAFGVTPESVSDEQRQIGKVIELSCIAEGQLVDTDHGLVPIENVTTDMKVWDGIEFVTHAGVVFRGVRDVISYDGLTATTDHVVWLEGACWPVQFGHAAASNAKLREASAPRGGIRKRASHLARKEILGKRGGLRASQVRGLFSRVVDVSSPALVGSQQRLSSVLSAAFRAPVALEARYSHAVAVHESKGCWLEALRRAWYTFRFSKRAGRRDMDSRQLRVGQSQRTRPHRQQRALCGGKSSLRYAVAKQLQPTALARVGKHVQLAYDRKSVRPASNVAVSESRLSQRGYYRHGLQSGTGQAEELARHTDAPTRARVYDIVNAGPRHRFTVSGKLVHNCGYQSGHGGFLAMAAGYDADIAKVASVVHDGTSPAEWAKYEAMYDAKGAQHFDLERYEWTAIKTLISKWRNANSAIRAFWHDVEEAAISAVKEPGRVTGVRGLLFFQVADNFLWMRLPSGRRLAYAYPSLGEVDTPWGERKPSVSVYGTEKGGFFKYHVYGGLLVENAVQAAARDILALAMLRLEKARYPIVMHTHDECAAEVARGFGSLEEYTAIMCALPDWASGLPVSVAGWRGKRYRKS